MDMSDRAKAPRGSRVARTIKPTAPDWPRWLDRDLQKKFTGVQFTTFWNVCAGDFGAYVTQRADQKPITKDQQIYIQGWMAGRDALVDYLEVPQ